MTYEVPESDLTKQQLAKLTNFRRELADALDAALVADGDVDLSDIEDRLDDLEAQPPGSNEISVKAAAYGAAGDGVTDDTAAITDALAAAQAQGKTLVFPDAGVYLITSAIDLTAADGVVIRGASKRPTIRFHSATPAQAGQNAFELTGCNNVTFENLHFLGDTDDDAIDNTGAGVYLISDCVDITIRGCSFENNKAVTCSDSAVSRRLIIDGCVIKNAPLAVNPSADCLIVNTQFVNDTVVLTRAQAIYSFGQQINISIQNCTFKNITKQAIQIRAGNSRFQSRDNFRIIGNHFENCAQQAVWLGSDAQPDIGEAIISNNTFKNCAGSINGQGLRSGVINGNHFEWDWEYPFALDPVGAINVSGDMAQSGHWNVARGVVISNNKFIVRHPWVGKIVLSGIPTAGDTVTIGSLTYTWRAAPSVELDVQIGGNIAVSVDNLRSTVAGMDGLTTYPNPVLRYVTDAMCNKFAVPYGLTDFDTLVLASWSDFVMSKSCAVATLTQAEDYRNPSGTPINVATAIAPLICNNHFDDCGGGMSLTQNVSPTVYDNVFVSQSSFAMFSSQGNVYSKYRGNRLIELRLAAATRQLNSSIDDGFAVIEDDYVMRQQATYPDLGTGRCGIIGVGDQKAHTYFYFGQEANGDIAAPSLPFRWEDGDLVRLYDGSTFTSFKFKRSAPGAGEFNDADSFLALINATPDYDAAYVSYVADLGGTDPEKMIKISFAAAGAVVAVDTALTVRRCKTPADTATFLTVPQPLLNGIVLRETETDPFCEDGHFYGGYATATGTFVHTPLANTKRPVFVAGYDAASHALAPVVYAADIVSGVGFKITHTAAAGTEKFFWRVG